MCPSFPSEDELKQHTLAVAQTVRVHEDSFIKGLSNVSTKHLKRKDGIFETFLTYLVREPHLKSLTKLYHDPQDKGQLVTSFILLTRGPKSKEKFDILNSLLICFVKNHKMKKKC